MNLKKCLRSKLRYRFLTGQAIVEYIMLFTILGVLFAGMIWVLGVDNPPAGSDEWGVRGGLNLRGAFNDAVDKAVEHIRRN